jgi:PAS domain S-box-containing protein
MPVSSRTALVLALFLACLIVGIEFWMQSILPWTPLWLVQIVLLLAIIYLLAREMRRYNHSEQRFAKIFYASPAGTLLSRQVDGRCLLANDRFLQLTGYSREELLGHTTLELAILSPALRQSVLNKVTSQGSAQGFDLQLTSKQGTPVDVHYVIVPIEVDGTPCLLSSFYDISARKQMECELRRLNAELEQRVAARTAELETALAEQQHWQKLKGDFLGMVGHELRTPLTGVLTMTELLADQVHGSLNDRQLVYARSAYESAERLLELVNSIMTYTHLISGDVSLQYETCHLAYQLETASASLAHKARKKRQSFTVEVDPPDLTITTDVGALSQVIKRLLDNAVKFTPEGGAIGIYAHLLAAGETVQMVIWDTGIGLAGHTLEDLVQPFTQGQDRLTRHYEGIGMGLAYVHRMLPLIGGSLEVHSSSGGSRFIVTLPTTPQSKLVRPLQA